MRLWTIQPPSVFELIQQTGVYRCNPDFSNNPEPSFRDAYVWLHSKMKEQIGPAPEGVTDPVWAWHTWEGNRKKPDFRTTIFRNHTKDQYLFEIEIPDNQVLLTDYDNWHYVLNKWWYHEEDPDEIWEERNEWWWNLPGEEGYTIALQSWNQFIGKTERELSEKQNANIQATFWELRADQIVKTWYHPAHNQ